jgi:predicted nucleic acid-binding protein
LRGLLDTSVLIGHEHERELARLPDEAPIPVMTLAELHVGVLPACSPRLRARRLRVLALVERTFDPLPVDAAVSRVFAEIVTDARRKRRLLIRARQRSEDRYVRVHHQDHRSLGGDRRDLR